MQETNKGKPQQTGSDTYVRRDGGDTWHWMNRCSKMPAVAVGRIGLPKGQRPRSGELCNECLAKEKAAATPE